jgi:adenosylcobinamide-GDP ribazoletransferase
MAALQSLRLAFAFLTRVPVGMARGNVPHPARSLAFFPVVGAALGGVLFVLAALLLRAHVPPNLTAIALVAALAALTGGLHLDGVADVFDALGGGRGDRERMLAIMRDSRIGAHGAVGLCLLLLAKTAAAAEALAHGAAQTLLLFPAVARWAVLPLVAYFPSARSDGLGASFHADARTLDVALATVVVIGLLAWTRPLALVAAVVALACALAFGTSMHARLGGLTGDVHGAAIEIAELVFLVLAVH